MTTGTPDLMYFVIGLAVLCSCAPVDAKYTGSHSNGASYIGKKNGVVYPPEEVTAPAEIQKVSSYFNEALRGLGQRVRSCSDVVRIQIGKDSLIYGQGLAAYGAYCTLGNGKAAVMCYEEASGRFAFVSGSYSPERSWVAAFTSRTCTEL